jgi:hypothetical protein
MDPKSRSAERRSRVFGLDLVAVRSEIVVLKWCSPYYQTRSKKLFEKAYARANRLTITRAIAA